MPLISFKTIVTSLSLFHLTLAFFFLTSPRTIADQALVYFVGEAMGLPYTRAFDAQSPALAFLAVALAYMGVGDIASLSLTEEICLAHHWGTQAPLRLVLSLCFVAYTFLLGPSSPFYAPLDPRGRFVHPSAGGSDRGYNPSGWGGDALKNRVFFTFMFIEMLSWFWAYITLREERSQLAERKGRRRSSQSLGAR